ncbi:MAG: hypothetical protein V4692_00230 [Bdellovibrionota bacterium]
MRNFLRLIILILMFFNGHAPAAASARGIEFTVSVDWEGRDLSETNLQAMRDFRDKYPDIHLVHFLNAAYFTKPGVNADEVRSKIQSVLRPGDELGLHIHAWKYLFVAAGVELRPVRTFWGYPETVQPDGDVGHQDVLSDFTVEEIRKVIRYSVAVLNKNGFTDISSFRAGGWMGGPNVLEALVLEGFVSDSSAVPSILLEAQLKNRPLLKYIENFWGKITIKSRPYTIKTAAGPIKEFPNTAGLADYVDGDQVFQIFKSQIKYGRKPYLHFGFHQETASRFLPEVARAIDLLSDHANSTGKSIAAVRMNAGGRSCSAVLGSENGN